jgi:hypothetical protein
MKGIGLILVLFAMFFGPMGMENIISNWINKRNWLATCAVIAADVLIGIIGILLALW